MPTNPPSQEKAGQTHAIADAAPQYPCELYSPKGGFWSYFHSFGALAGELEHGWTMWRKPSVEVLMEERDGYRIRLTHFMTQNASSQRRIAELTEALTRVTGELAELIKDEQDDKSVGITGWTALHESVAAARELLSQGAPK